MSPTRVVIDDDEQQIADLLKQVRTLRSRLATTAVKGSHDEFTAAATPSTTYTLTYIPLTGTCLMALNGHVQREGTDYTCDYDTGIVTVSATQASGDKITFRYLVTDWLIARSLPADDGSIADDFNRANSSSLGNTSVGNVPWTNLIGVNGISSNRAANVSYSTDGLDSRAISYVDPGSNNGTLQATLHVSGTTGHFTPCLAFRIQDDKHMWLLGAAGLIKVSFASGTIQFTSIISPGYVDGDVAKVVLSGSTITAYKNGSVIGTGPITDSSYVTETKHGMFFEDQGVGITQSLDDWSWSP